MVDVMQRGWTRYLKSNEGSWAVLSWLGWLRMTSTDEDMDDVR